MTSRLDMDDCAERATASSEAMIDAFLSSRDQCRWCLSPLAPSLLDDRGCCSDRDCQSAEDDERAAKDDPRPYTCEGCGDRAPCDCSTADTIRAPAPPADCE